MCWKKKPVPPPVSPPPAPPPMTSAKLGFAQSELAWGDAHMDGTTVTKVCAGVAALGGRYIRFSALWSFFEPQVGAGFSWANLDRAVNAATSAGLEPILCVNDVIGTSRTAEQYGAACGAIAARYGAQVHKIEIWNEQNTGGFWDHGDASTYTPWLTAAYAAIKAANPTIQVCVGGLQGTGTWPPSHNVDPAEFLTGVYAAGGQGYFDAVAMHPYTYSRSWVLEPPSPTQLYIAECDELHNIMAAHGDGDKPVWITEYGYNTTELDQKTQADYLSQEYSILAGKPFIDVICIYNYHDSGAGGVEGTWGVVNPDFSHKLAWTQISAPPPATTLFKRIWRSR